MTTRKDAMAAQAAKAPEAATEFVAGKGFVSKSIADMAKTIAATPKVRQTPIKAKAEPKRPPTDADTLGDALVFFESLVDTGLSKVDYVRELALWDGRALQRKDAMEIIATHPELEIATATVSSQFQFVRSGRVPYAPIGQGKA